MSNNNKNYLVGDKIKSFDLSVADELKLLEFYPKCWQVSFSRTSHPWVLHMSLWHYWLWFTFIVGMSLYIVFLFFMTCTWKYKSQYN